MRLRYLTITGADDNVQYEQMLELHKKYPFVEWAILFSQSKSGVSRYPGWDWVMGLMDFVKKHSMNLSAHLCGKWVRDILEGKFTFIEDQKVSHFQRIQLNLGADNLKPAIASETFLNVVRNATKPILLGGKYNDLKPDYEFFLDFGLNPLFDASGGHGVVAKEWPTPPRCNLMCGYAGGFGPENLREQLQNIEKLVGEDDQVWADMESRVRTNDKLDFNKVKQVLDIAREWAVDGYEVSA